MKVASSELMNLFKKNIYMKFYWLRVKERNIDI